MEMIDVVAIGREFLLMSLVLSAPVVVVSLFVGLVISVGQTVTSVQEQTLSFAPRIIAVVIVLILLANWYLVTLQKYTLDVFSKMVEFIR